MPNTHLFTMSARAVHLNWTMNWGTMAPLNRRVAKLVRAPPWHGGGPWFESNPPYQMFASTNPLVSGFFIFEATCRDRGDGSQPIDGRALVRVFSV